MNKTKQDLTIYQMEQSSIEFKKTHTISVSGLKDNEPPKWFSDFANQVFQRLDNIESRLEKHDKMFKMIFNRIDNLVAKNNLKE